MTRHTSTHAGRTARALLALALLVLTLAMLPVNSLAAPLAVHTIDIDDARGMPLGSTVTVKGSVTVPSGAFSSSSFDEGFAIQDRSGGIYVSIATNLGLAPRQQVRVTGHLADNGFGLLTLVVDHPSDVKTLGAGPKVHPAPFSTGAIGEATEGRLVVIVATITQPVVNDLPFGYQVFVNDGSGQVQVFVNASTGIDVSGLHAGQRVRVIGFSGQFETHFEVDPRFQSDIQVL